MRSDKRVLAAIGLAICLTAISSRAGMELTTLASFDGTNGLFPGMLIQTTDGSLLGTAREGGIGFNGSYGGNGVIFKLTMDGVLSTLAAFDGSQGAWPGFMLQAADHSFYGTLRYGYGALFKLNSDGSLTNYNPVSFGGINGGTNGLNPVWLVQDHAGNLYGVTSGSPNSPYFATVFKIDTNSIFSTVARFNGEWLLSRISDYWY